MSGIFCRASEHLFVVYYDLNGVLTLHNESMGYTSVGIAQNSLERLKWTGNDFYVTWSSTVNTQTSKYTIEGRVEPDASAVETITLTKEFTDTNYQGRLWTSKEVLILKNVQITKYNCGDNVRFFIHLEGETPTGAPLADRVEYQYESRIVGYYGDLGDRLDRFETFIYTDNKPIIEIEFTVEHD